jgi:hypothetical protein
MKTYGGVDVQIHVFLTSELVCEWSAAERVPGTQWLGGWVGPRTDLDDTGRRKIFPYRD